MSMPAAERGTLPPRRTSIVVLLVFATLGSLLGLFTAGDNVLSIDVTVLEAIQKIDWPGVDTVARISNVVFGTAGALVFAALFVIVALMLDRRVFAVQLVVVVALRLAGQVLKPLFDSPRPGIEYQPDPSLVSDSMGYPSGHAFTATIITTVIVLFIHSLDVPRWLRVLSVVVAVLATLVALFSRVRVGAHWPTDTIGGVCYGLATVALMQLIVGAMLERTGSLALSRTRRTA